MAASPGISERVATSAASAAARRASREALVEAVAAGHRTVADVLQSTDDIARSLRVSVLLEHDPALGKVAARRLLADLDVPLSMVIGALDDERRAILVGRVR